MDGLWHLEQGQGEIQKVAKPGEKQWFLKFPGLKLTYQLCKQKGELAVNTTLYCCSRCEYWPEFWISFLNENA